MFVSTRSNTVTEGRFLLQNYSKEVLFHSGKFTYGEVMSIWNDMEDRNTLIPYVPESSLSADKYELLQELHMFRQAEYELQTAIPLHAKLFQYSNGKDPDSKPKLSFCQIFLTLGIPSITPPSDEVITEHLEKDIKNIKDAFGMIQAITSRSLIRTECAVWAKDHNYGNINNDPEIIWTAFPDAPNLNLVPLIKIIVGILPEGINYNLCNLCRAHCPLNVQNTADTMISLHSGLFEL